MPERERVKGQVCRRPQRAATGPGPRGGALARGAQTALVLGVGIVLVGAVLLSVFRPEPGPRMPTREEREQRQRDIRFVSSVGTLEPTELEHQLDEGRDPDTRGEHKQTPLQVAVRAGREDLVEVLLERGADPSLAGEMERTPLMEAAASGETEIVKLLLAQGADPNQVVKNPQGEYRRALEWAVRARYFETARALLEGGADWDIFMAAGLGDEEMVKEALAAGAKVNDVDDRGTSALSWAAGGGHENMVVYLLDQGASAAEDPSWHPVLSRAVLGGNPEVLRRLLEAGASPRSGSEGGRSALHAAAVQGEAEMVRLLLEAGVSPLPKSEEERSPLHWAAAEGKVEVVRVLLDAGVSVDLKHVIPRQQAGRGYGFKDSGVDQYRTPLTEAAARAHPEVVELLLKRGADPNAGATVEQRPLYRVAAGGTLYGRSTAPDEEERMETARVLLEYGADPEARSEEGASAAEAAQKVGRSKLAVLLGAPEEPPSPEERPAAGKKGPIVLHGG